MYKNGCGSEKFQQRNNHSLPNRLGMKGWRDEGMKGWRDEGMKGWRNADEVMME